MNAMTCQGDRYAITILSEKLKSTINTGISMHKHPYFDLLLLDEVEFTHHFQQEILTRTVVQEWPLSAVEEISLKDRTIWMVKSVREPLTIEGDFYKQVVHPAVPAAEVLYDEHPFQCLRYQKLSGSHPALQQSGVDGALSLMESLLSIIASLPEGNLPHRLDISTPQAFQQRFTLLIEKLHELVHQCPQAHYALQDCDNLLPIINDQNLVHSLTYDSTYVHGDLSTDNILIAPDGSLFILDWQRMVYGSPLLDRYTFLSSMGVSPEDHLPPEASIIAYLERIDWFTDTALYWFPSFREGYTASIAELLQALLPAYQKFCSE
jgi:hypothetical protein